jgi:hypothetical protein
MGGGGIEDLSGTAQLGRIWPTWARRVVTGLLLYHLAAVLVGALAAAPASPLEQGLWGLFRNYYGLADQGYAYRFYAPEPPPTPVVVATLRFKDGTERTVRLPDRALRPRLRYQRHLALANTLAAEVAADRQEHDRPPGLPGPPPEHRHDDWARSYARHLCLAYGDRGCAAVTLSLRLHLIPDLLRVRAALAAGPSAKGVDLDDEEFYTVPEKIGEFSCDDF